MTTHAIERALERYGLQLSKNDFERISKRIAQGQAEKLKKVTKHISVYEIYVNSIRIKLVYDRHTKFVITVLPPDWTPEPPAIRKLRDSVDVK